MVYDINRFSDTKAAWWRKRFRRSFSSGSVSRSRTLV